MQVKLGQLACWDNFPDGIARSQEIKIINLIKTHGPIATIEIDEFTDDGLTTALRSPKIKEGWITRKRHQIL